jgi:hypothetical protein
MTSLTNNQITALTATTRTTDELDSIIFEIQTTTSLSSEARNSLHACMTRHPWGRGKSIQDRIADVRCAIAGKRLIDGNLIQRINRIARSAANRTA